jgi:hypothetical protein
MDAKRTVIEVTQAAKDGSTACERAITTKTNIVIDVLACTAGDPTGHGVALAKTIVKTRQDHALLDLKTPNPSDPANPFSDGDPSQPSTANQRTKRPRGVHPSRSDDREEEQTPMTPNDPRFCVAIRVDGSAGCRGGATVSVRQRHERLHQRR